MAVFYAVVKQDYKVHRKRAAVNNFDYQKNADGPVLFNLVVDPNETINVAAGQPDIVAQINVECGR